MLSSVSVWFLLLIIISTVALAFPFWRRERRMTRKILLAFLVFSVFFYSGAGISAFPDKVAYFIKYLVFLGSMLFSLSFAWKIRIKSKAKSKHLSNDNSRYLRHSIIFTFLSYVFIASILIYLFIPNLRLQRLISPPLPSLVDIFRRREILQSNRILSIADMLNTLLLPPFLIHIYILLKKGEKTFAAIWIISWFYLDYLKYEYWGRNNFLVNGLFFLMILFSVKREQLTINRRQLIAFIIALILMVPLLLMYESFRLGVAGQMASFSAAIAELLAKEADYPKYYNAIITTFDGSLVSQFFAWLLAIPIPSAIWNGKPTMDINSAFTTAILGMQRGDRGFYIILPSMLGEGLFVFGRHFYWITGAIFGFILGLFSRFFESKSIFLIINVYYIALILIIGRAGLQSYLPFLINGNLMTLFIYLVFAVPRIRKQE